MIHEISGSIFDSEAVALVNPVNTVGVSGKGLALEFKKRYPGAFKLYKDRCDAGLIKIGSVHLVHVSEDNPRFIVNFPTKRDWRKPSRMSYIQDGLYDMFMAIDELCIESIAIPALGCGLGGLDWDKVKQEIEFAAEAYHHIDITIYKPCP
jgi:O-acetyl-ADP-ribose deacetylase (regulator of RNase III)